MGLFVCFCCRPLQNPHQRQAYSSCLKALTAFIANWHHSGYRSPTGSAIMKSRKPYQEQLQQQHQQKQQALGPRFPTPRGPGAEAAGPWAAHTCRFRISTRSDPIGCNRESERGAGADLAPHKLEIPIPLSFGSLRRCSVTLSRSFLLILVKFGAYNPFIDQTFIPCLEAL